MSTRNQKKFKQIKKSSVTLEQRINKWLASGKYVEAAEALDRELAEKGYVDFGYSNLVALARVKMKLKSYPQAEKLLMAAIDVDELNIVAPENLVELYIANKQFGAAHRIVKLLLNHSPSSEKYRYWELLALCASRTKSDEVQVKWHEFIGEHPDYKSDTQLQSAYVTSLVSAGRYEQAARHVEDFGLDKVYDPQTAQFIPNLLVQMKKHNEAIAFLTEIIHRFPNQKVWRWNRALINLSVGQYKAGWEDYKNRWEWADFVSPRRTLQIPQWKGEKLEGRSILIWGEQGLGDQIMFGLVIVNILDMKPDRVRIEVPEKIRPLFQLWYPEAEVATFVASSNIDEKLEQDFDFQIPFGDLNGFFLNSEEAIRSTPKRLLKIDESTKQSCLQQFKADYPIVIGLAWRSHYVDSIRSFGYMNVDFVTYLVRNLPKEIGFVVLQYKVSDKEREVLSEFENVMIPDIDFFDDVLTHGKFCGSCDLVVSAGMMVWQLSGLFSVPIITWGAVNSWVNMGFENPPWFNNHNKIMLDNNYDRLAVAQIVVRKLKAALGVQR